MLLFVSGETSTSYKSTPEFLTLPGHSDMQLIKDTKHVVVLHLLGKMAQFNSLQADKVILSIVNGTGLLKALECESRDSKWICCQFLFHSTCICCHSSILKSMSSES